MNACPRMDGVPPLNACPRMDGVPPLNACPRRDGVPPLNACPRMDFEMGVPNAHEISPWGCAVKIGFFRFFLPPLRSSPGDFPPASKSHSVVFFIFFFGFGLGELPLATQHGGWPPPLQTKSCVPLSFLVFSSALLFHFHVGHCAVLRVFLFFHH